MKQWTKSEALELCKKVEAICPDFGCHVALTGGALYKEGPRKDLDLLFYRVRQVSEIDADGLFSALSKVGFGEFVGQGWVVKTSLDEKPIDCFFPEELEGVFGGGFKSEIEGGYE